MVDSKGEIIESDSDKGDHRGKVDARKILHDSEEEESRGHGNRPGGFS